MTNCNPKALLIIERSGKKRAIVKIILAGVRQCLADDTTSSQLNFLLGLGQVSTEMFTVNEMSCCHMASRSGETKEEELYGHIPPAGLCIVTSCYCFMVGDYSSCPQSNIFTCDNAPT